MEKHQFQVFSDDDIRSAVSMRESIRLMKAAFLQLSAGNAIVPQRMVMPTPPEDGLMLLMPAHITGGAQFSVKLITLYGDNPRQGLPLIQAYVMLFDARKGRLLAMMDGETITALRTGAASGAASDLLAKQDAQTVAIFGYGIQAETQLEAICAVRDIQNALVFGPKMESAVAFSGRMSDKLGITVRPATSADQLAQADIICTATTAAEPVFEDRHLAPGTHLNGVGSYKPDMREIPGETVKRARLVVDQRSACLSEAGDILLPIAEGIIEEGHIQAELGEILSGKCPGRQSPEQITFFKSVGNAIQDLALAASVWETAQRMPLGQTVRF